jgi:hypothetical protein
MKSKLLFSMLLSMVFSLSMMAQRFYWQQEIKYEMSIDFDVKSHTFDGMQLITYTNNSPDDINRVFYHLYFNAFQPGSMMDARNAYLPDADPRVGARISSLTPAEEGHLHAEWIKQNGREIRFIEEGTILEVALNEVIKPGESTTLEMKFKGQVPVQIRRTGRDNAEGISYSMSQWYPKLCEYDYRGWHANPYVGREFYGVWGDFDVHINIDKKFIVAATGVLQNADDIGYGYSKREKPKAKKGKVSWHFKADRVHDFVWAADPDYTHVVLKGQHSPEMHFFYQEGEDTEAWARLPEIMDDAFGYMNKKYGKYPFPVYSFIQGGDGGMEYPMATLITGNRSLPSLVGVSVHELLHSWYQMLLGTDEARFAWMDEGFTSYASTETMNYLKGKHGFGKVVESGELHIGSIRGMANFSKSGVDEPLSIHSDHFNTNAAYGVGAYVKGAVYLVQMRYLIGEEKFDQLMLDYFNTWKFKHPEPNDFLRIAEKISGLELDWFNQYYINTTHTIDYAIDSSWNGEGDQVTLRRVGLFPMPVDVRVDYMDGSFAYHTIPLRMMRGAKGSEKNIRYKVEPDWPWTHLTYQLKLEKGKKVKSIEIDPSQRLVDVNLENNVWGLN